MDPVVVNLLKTGATHSAARARQIEFVATDMYRTLGPILDEYDIFICPSLAVPATPAEHSGDDPDYTINGKKVDAMLQWAMTYPFNLVSQCPVASVPSGFASNGVPTGLQIVARTYDDLRVFRAAAAFESARPWRDKKPQL